MNKLEKHIFDAIYDHIEFGDPKGIARIAASIALELAEKAHGRGYWLGEHNEDGIEGWEDFEDFKQEIL